ncbi:MAG: TspO/MBR family protein [Lutibacter sp.]|nr:tryptophan-rich sensory protein [Lutibacter sp.]MDT8416686.1 TspO/MBR family protein [Lutibacter sp.]
MKKALWFLVFLVLNFGALGIGGLLMNNGPQEIWYMELNKAPWTPPGWFFGVAWTIIMIAFSIYMAYLIQLKSNVNIWLLFFVQFVLNTSWNYIFFNQHLVLLGLLVIVLLTILVGYFLLKFRYFMKQKTWFIVPYFIWLIVASSLNAYVYLNN